MQFPEEEKDKELHRK